MGDRSFALHLDRSQRSARASVTLPTVASWTTCRLTRKSLRWIGPPTLLRPRNTRLFRRTLAVRWLQSVLLPQSRGSKPHGSGLCRWNFRACCCVSSFHEYASKRRGRSPERARICASQAHCPVSGKIKRPDFSQRILIHPQ